MVTVAELKDKLKEYLSGMDFSKTSMLDLTIYVDVLEKLDRLDAPKDSAVNCSDMICGGYYSALAKPTKETAILKKSKGA